MRANLVDGLISLMYVWGFSDCMVRRRAILTPAALFTVLPAKTKNSSAAPETMLSVFAAVIELMLSYAAPTSNSAFADDCDTPIAFGGKLPKIALEIPSMIFLTGDLNVSTINREAFPVLAIFFLMFCINMFHGTSRHTSKKYKGDPVAVFIRALTIMGRYHQGKFKPKNPKKYKGDASNIVYRSSWELKLMSYLDQHPDVLEWNSECVVIPYRSPVDGKLHRYFPDFYVKRKDRDGVVESILVEVKPHAQTLEPKVQSNVTKRYINEVYTYGINKAKWIQAQEYCKDRGWKFMILTENDLGIKF